MGARRRWAYVLGLVALALIFAAFLGSLTPNWLLQPPQTAPERTEIYGPPDPTVR